MPHYLVKKTAVAPSSFDDPVWLRAGIATIDRFRPESSDHHPVTTVRVLHDGTSLHCLFSVRDRYVRCRYTQPNDPVCRDSCVELFVKPGKDTGYFNFEFNAGGTLLASHITDHTRVPGGFKAFAMLDRADFKQMNVLHSLPPTIDPEIPGPTEWKLMVSIPTTILETRCGKFGNLSGKRWSGNFFKCGDETSHPHWASWSPVTALNFHLPECFGELEME